MKKKSDLEISKIKHFLESQSVSIILILKNVL